MNWDSKKGILTILIFIILIGSVISPCQAFSGFGQGFLSFQNKIKIHGETRFLVTAEFPYYRLSPKVWSERLDLVKDVGINIVTFYIPWNIHELLPGKFDFEGRIREQNNLNLFLSLLREKEMYAIVKPGPFICAEVHHGGIPDWVTSQHPDVVMRSSEGSTVGFRQDGLPLPAYLNPDYVSLVKSWYDVLSKIVIVPNQYPNGPIIAVQIENEIPYSTSELANPFSWGYSTSTVSLYRKWLKEKYHDIAQYNSQHIPQIADFKFIEPPTNSGWHLPCAKAWLTYQDWVEFKSFYVTKVLRIYSSILRDSGVTLPFYHNILMLDDESPVNYDEMRRVMYIGPNYWLPSNPMDDEQSYFYGLERILLANSVNNGYSYVPEMNWGWGTGQEHDFLTRCLLSELSGFNVYPIVDGANAGTLNGARYSNNPEPYPGGAPIDVNGIAFHSYYYLKRLVTFLNAVGSRFSQSRKGAEIAVGYYSPYNYPRSYIFWANEPISAFKEVFKEEIDQNKNLFYIIKTFSNHFIDFTVVNLSYVTLENLRQHRMLFIQSYKYMDKITLIKLLDYVKDGGILVMGPEFPSLDIEMSLLKDLPISTRWAEIVREREMNQPISIRKSSNKKLQIAGHLNYFANGKNCEVLAQEKGAPYILQFAHGKGQVILVGFNYYLAIKDNWKFFRSLFEKFNIDPRYCWIPEQGSEINIFRRASENGVFLFVTNRSEDDKVVEIDYLDELRIIRKLYVSVRSKGNSIIETKRGYIVSAAIQGSGSCVLRTECLSIIAEGINEFIFAQTNNGKHLIVGERTGKVTVQSSVLQPNISVTRLDGKSVGRYVSDKEFEFEYSPREDLNPYVFVGW